MRIGFLIGLIIGGTYTFLFGPRIRISDYRRQARTFGEPVTDPSQVPLTPLEESLMEGKAAAQRRRDELGLQDKG